MTKVKICGIKTVEDAMAANACMPDFAGFVFAKTKRYVTDEQAWKIKQALSAKIKTVGVFVNEPQEHICSLVQKKIIDLVQLHGDENDDYIKTLKSKIDIPVIKAIRVQEKEQVIKALSKYADYFLFDTYKKDTYGGTGEKIPLLILKESIAQLWQDSQKRKPYFIAGGLDVEHVQEVLAHTQCFGVDVSSGVETDGKKDAHKMKAFVERVKRL